MIDRNDLVSSRGNCERDIQESNAMRENIPWPRWISPYRQLCKAYHCGQFFHQDLREKPTDYCPKCRGKNENNTNR